MLADHRLNSAPRSDTTYLDLIASYQEDMSVIEHQILQHQSALSAQRAPAMRVRSTGIQSRPTQPSIKDRYRTKMEDLEESWARTLVEATGCTLAECLWALRLNGGCLDTAAAHLLENAWQAEESSEQADPAAPPPFWQAANLEGRTCPDVGTAGATSIRVDQAADARNQCQTGQEQGVLREQIAEVDAGEAEIEQLEQDTHQQHHEVESPDDSDSGPEQASGGLVFEDGVICGQLVVPVGVHSLGIVFASHPPGHPEVRTVIQGSWADSIGIKSGFVIVEVNGHDLENQTEQFFFEQMQVRPLTIYVESVEDEDENDIEDSDQQMDEQFERRNARFKKLDDEESGDGHERDQAEDPESQEEAEEEGYDTEDETSESAHEEEEEQEGEEEEQEDRQSWKSGEHRFADRDRRGLHARL